MVSITSCERPLINNLYIGLCKTHHLSEFNFRRHGQCIRISHDMTSTGPSSSNALSKVVNTSSGSLTLNPAIPIASPLGQSRDSAYCLPVRQSVHFHFQLSPFHSERLLNTMILIGNLYWTTVSKSPKVIDNPPSPQSATT